MQTFTEVDFYKAIQNLLYRVINITEQQVPVEQDGKIAYPIDNGEMAAVKNDVESLERALVILKNNNS